MEAVSQSHSLPLGSVHLLKGDLSGSSLDLPQDPRSSSNTGGRPGRKTGLHWRRTLACLWNGPKVLDLGQNPFCKVCFCLEHTFS